MGFESKKLATATCAAMSLMFVTPALAQHQASPSPEDLKAVAGAMTLKASPGRATATPHAPQWCDIIGRVEGSWGIRSLERGIGDPKRTNLDNLVEAAKLTCIWPKEPAVHKAVAQIEQYWINWTGLPVNKAAETFKLRLKKDRWEADRKAACGANAGDDEVGGEEQVFAKARRTLFGCGHEGTPVLWLSGGGYKEIDEEVMVYLDGSATGADELVRLAYLAARTRFVLDAESKGENYDKQLTSYITDQFDLAALNEAELMKQVEAKYKGNTFVRGVAIETLGRVRTAAAEYKADVDKKASDASWKQLLITAPQQGAAELTAATTKWKEQLARSMELEKKYFGPSRNAVKGCWPALSKDFSAVAATLKKSTPQELESSLNDPIASLLFTRLAACAVVDADAAYANRLVSIARELRPARGPRLAAYYAALDALTAIREDRKKFPIEQNDLKRYLKVALVEQASNDIEVGKSKIDVMGWVGDGGAGAVKAVKKTPTGLQVTFVTTKYQTMSQSCTETNRIVMFRHDGTPIYYRNCKDTGLVWVDSTPGTITVPDAWASGIKVGAFVEFVAARGNDEKRVGLPVGVWADKSKKKGLVNYYGLAL